MPQSPQPLDKHQLELVNIVKSAHGTLGVARKVKASEVSRRVAEARTHIELESQKRIEEAEARIRMDVDAEIARHESALDEAIIAAYNNDIPIRRIALDGFGNRHDGAVHQMLRDLRADGRVGNRSGYQRRSGMPELESRIHTNFPEPIDMDQTISEALMITEPTFTAVEEPLVLVEPDRDGMYGVTVQSVRLTMDERDPYFARIAKNAREGTPHLRARSCTLYIHPATQELTVLESKENGVVTWDHPVARWVKDNYDQSVDGYSAAIWAGTQEAVTDAPASE